MAQITLNSSGVASNGTLALQSNGTTTAVTIDASQNVGIGTASPAKKLVLAGDNTGLAENNTLRFWDTDNGTEANQQIGKIEFFSSDVSTPGASVKAYIGAFAEDTTPDAYLAFATDSSTGTATERMRIDSSGNVGIGTSSPTVKLDVRGNVLKIYDSGSTNANLTVRNSTTGDAAGFTLQQDGVNTLFYNNSNGASVFATNGTERARIDSSGNLLVGASSSTWLGSLLKSGGTITLASGASINLSSAICGGAIVSVYVVGSGNGGLFYLNYSAVAAKITGDGAATDTGADFAVYKSAASHTSTLKNKSVSTQTFSVVVVAGQIS